MKERYEKPAVESEKAFETLAAGCTYISAEDQTSCDPEVFGTELRS